MSSLTDNASADWTLTFQTPFIGTEYVVVGIGKAISTVTMAMIFVSNLDAPTSTSIRVFCAQADTAAIDAPIAYVTAFGRT